MSLITKTVTGIKWTSISALFITLLRIVQIAILARFLEPSDFGTMAIVNVLIGFSSIFMDAGVGNAIIFKQDISLNQLFSLYWFNIIASLIIYMIIFLLSPVVVFFYNDEALKVLIILAALNILFVSFGQQHRILLQKELHFQRLAEIEIISFLIAFVATITSAFLGAGIFALIVSSLVNSLVSSMLVIKVSKFSFFCKKRLNIKDLGFFIKFGMFQLGEKTLSYFSKNLDKLIIGKILGPELLGFYDVAIQMIFRPIGIINSIINRVSFPTFSKLQNDIIKLKDLYLKKVSTISIITVPIYSLLYAISEELFAFIYGEGWKLSSEIFNILWILGIFWSIGKPLGSLLLSLGKANYGFYMNAAFFIVYLFVSYYGALNGIFFLVWATLIVNFILFLPVDYFVRYKLVGMKILEHLNTYIKPFSISITILFIINVFKEKVKIYIGSIEIYTILVVIFYLSGYLVSIYIFEKKLILQLLKKFKNK